MRVFKCKFQQCREFLVKPGYCDAHRAYAFRAKHQKYDSTRRDDEMRRFYQSTVWRKTRAAKLSLNPFCEVCNRNAANVVHHTTPAKHLSILERCNLDILQSVCPTCHTRLEKSNQYSPTNWDELRNTDKK